MPRTAYCKKCRAEVPAGPLCPRCGGKLPRSAVHLVWQTEHTPLRDWMSWNAVMRILLPVLGTVLLLALLLETVSGGLRAAERLLLGGFTLALTGILLIACVSLLVLFILQGDELLSCEISGRGMRVSRVLVSPSRLDLIARFQSPALLRKTDPETGLLPLPPREIAWKEIRRVQLWPEKSTILLYAPSRWLRLALPCDPFVYGEALDWIQEKLGKSKQVILPPELRQEKPGSAFRPAEIPEYEAYQTEMDFAAPPAEPEPETETEKAMPQEETDHEE